MPMTLKLFSLVGTTATFEFYDLAADGTVDVQLAHDPAFSFCVCPILNVPQNKPSESVVIQGLNADATIYARCRARRVSGAVEPWSAVIAVRTANGAARNTAPAAVMIEPAIIVVPERVLSWTVPNAVAGFPATNLGRDAPVGLKAIDFGGGVQINATLSGAPIDTIAILNTNLPEAATVTILAGPTQDAIATGVGRTLVANNVPFRASPNLPGRPGYHGLFRFNQVALPFWQIQLIGPKPANTAWVEHVVFGLNRATKNHSVDKSEAALPRTTVDRTRSGNPDRPDGLPMRRVEFEISMMTEAQYELTYGDLHRFENEAVLVVPNSKSGAFLHDRILFGDLKGGRSLNPFSPRYSRSFTIESLI